MARKTDPKKKSTTTARKKPSQGTSTAKSGSGKDAGRVKQTFAAGKDDGRS